MEKFWDKIYWVLGGYILYILNLCDKQDLVFVAGYISLKVLNL
jgi:hypothetical protein